MSFLSRLSDLLKAFRAKKNARTEGELSENFSFAEPAVDEPFPEPVTIEIGDVFDLHTIAPRDVRRAVEEYLSEAHRLGFPAVRIIHGKGIGVQRRTVREVLERTPFVREYMDAPPHAGGLGATIAHLDE